MISAVDTVGVDLHANSVDIQAGALLDLSGGGTLTGAGFVSGRSGSVDVRSHALRDANPAYTFSASSNAGAAATWVKPVLRRCCCAAHRRWRNPRRSAAGRFACPAVAGQRSACAR
ncbi:hypothetical protein G6F61_014411 [Rhizopus arrhizus]|nr:hypothetical protein G6F61_014411 [Rhizopus arrhizus]